MSEQAAKYGAQGKARLGRTEISGDKTEGTEVAGEQAAKYEAQDKTRPGQAEISGDKNETAGPQG